MGRQKRRVWSEVFRRRPLLWTACLILLGGALGYALARPQVRVTAGAPTEAIERGNAARGLELMEKFECARCHQSEVLAAPAPERDCTGCHQDIMAGRFDASAEDMRHYQSKIRHFVSVPALESTQTRFRRAWLIDFLLCPHDLRPGLEETMPRLPLEEADARDIAEYLAPRDGDMDYEFRGDVEEGRTLYRERGCRACHEFSGVEARLMDGEAEQIGRTLAPDLLVTRERFLPESLVGWLMAPERLLPTTKMPNHGLTDGEAQSLAAFIFSASVRTNAPQEPPLKPPPVAREVFFDEVNERVFRTSCWHCHSDPDFSMGDEGPGNVGGFGFMGVGLQLASYEGVLGGAYPSGLSILDTDTGTRARDSIVDQGRPAASRLVRALRARQVEERGGEVPGVRGMPLALPALSDEDIALVEAWIRQGARF